MKLTRKAFTLVELIIVIAIIAVLAVSAFMVLTKWLGKSRDSRRLGDIGSIERSLTTWLSDYDANGKGLLVSPSGSETITLNGVVVATWDTFNDYFDKLKTVKFDVLQKVVKDPNNKDQYAIAIVANKKFAVAATLENDGTYKAAVRTNYQSGSVVKGVDGSTNYSGATIIGQKNTNDKPIVDGWSTLPYSLTDNTADQN